jgi:hypothetical protein
MLSFIAGAAAVGRTVTSARWWRLFNSAPKPGFCWMCEEWRAGDNCSTCGMELQK